jgi:hypothetical protein
MTQGGLGYTELRGGTREAALARDGDQCKQVVVAFATH